MSRLEEIKEELFEIELPDYIENHIYWLIDRVEELENEYQVRRVEMLEEHIERLEKVNQRYREFLWKVHEETENDGLHYEIYELLERDTNDS